MATAWEILVSGSLLPEIGNTAWDHLNAQGGNGGTLELTDGLEIEMEDCNFEVSMYNDPYEVEVEEDQLEVEIDTTEFELEVC